MELEKFIENFAEQFSDTDPNNIKADTIFRDLEEWSSLIALSVIAMIDEEYEIILKGEDMRKAITVAELYEIVKNKIK